MNTRKLVDLINLSDRRLETTPRIETVGAVGGIGNPYARCPTIETVWRGIDWSSGALILRPSVKLRLADKQAPVAMVLHCPECGTQHIDKPENDVEYEMRISLPGQSNERWTNPPHKSHLCLKCDIVWRPAEIYTEGVESVPRGERDTWP